MLSKKVPFDKKDGILVDESEYYGRHWAWA